MANKDQPLTVEVVGGLLTISIGVSTLCRALEAKPLFADDGEGRGRVTDEYAFVRAIVGELKNDSHETALTPVARMLDGAAQDAIEAGCDGVRFPGDA